MATIKGKRKGFLGAVVRMKVVAHKRPVSGEVIGYRVVVAVPNTGRWCQKEERYVQSFHPKYRVAESGDYTTDTEVVAALEVWQKMFSSKYRVELWD